MAASAILFLTPELPYPPRSGGRIKSWRMVCHLAARYPLTLGCLLKGDDAAHLAAMRAALPESVTVFHAAVNRPRSVSNLLRSYAQRQPLNVYRTASATFAAAVRAHAPAHDVILLDHYEVAQYRPDDFPGAVVLHEHNAYFAMWQRFAARPGPWLPRWVAAGEARRVRRYEVRACRRADRVLAAPNDIESLAEAGVDRARCRTTFHLGDEAALTAPALTWETTERRLLYFGLLSWEANADGLRWFLKAVWPDLVRDHPDLRLDIAGGGADTSLQALVRERPGVRLLGFVEDLEPLFRRSRVFIAPLRFGAGIKVKVLTALARGLPTVTTPVGAEGLAVQHGEQLAIAEAPGPFAAAVSELLDDPARWQHLSTAARSRVAERYTWARVLGDLEAAIDEAVATRR